MLSYEILELLVIAAVPQGDSHLRSPCFLIHKANKNDPHLDDYCEAEKTYMLAEGYSQNLDPVPPLRKRNVIMGQGQRPGTFAQSLLVVGTFTELSKEFKC